MHPSIYCFTSFVTSGYQKFLITNFTVFHCPLYPLTGVLWCNLIIFAFNFLSLGTYTFPFLYIMLSISLHSSSLSIFTPAHFISSITLTTSSSLTLDCLTFSSKSTFYMITYLEEETASLSHEHLLEQFHTRTYQEERRDTQQNGWKRLETRESPISNPTPACSRTRGTLSHCHCFTMPG